MIHLGCSGWSYNEWVGPFYKTRAQDKLVQYSRIFNSVEINSTFYRTPPPEMVRGWIRKVSGRTGFRFTVKLPRDLSHDLLLHSGKSSAYFMESFESQVLQSLESAGLLGSLLLQLPPFFKEEHVPILMEFLGLVDTEKYRYAVEFRHKFFYDNTGIRNDLSSMGVGVVDIDSPEHGLEKISSGLDWAYLRLHGRNSQEWYKRSDTMARYRYDYSDGELESMASLVRSSGEKYRDLYIYFNNHPDGNAATNGMALSRLLGVESPGSREDITNY